jgi:hypothetical protein
MAKNIHEAVLAVMQEIDYVQKEKSKDVNYTLKTENAVIQALRPSMLKHGIYMYPIQVAELHHDQFEAGKYKNVWNRLVAVHTYRFVHGASDTHIDVAVLGDGADTGDKAGNKSMTTSKKYALLETFLLMTGDEPDETPSSDMARSSVVDDKARTAWKDLLDRAQEASVKPPKVNLDKITKDELREAYRNLLNSIEAVEEIKDNA